MANALKYEARISILETSMEWAIDTGKELKRGLVNVKQNQVKLFDMFGELRTEMHSEIGKVRSEMKTEFGAVRCEIAELRGEFRRELQSEIGALRSEMHKSFSVQTRWMVLALLGATSLNSALMTLILKLFFPVE